MAVRRALRGQTCERGHCGTRRQPCRRPGDSTETDLCSAARRDGGMMASCDQVDPRSSATDVVIARRTAAARVKERRRPPRTATHPSPNNALQLPAHMETRHKCSQATVRKRSFRGSGMTIFYSTALQPTLSFPNRLIVVLCNCTSISHRFREKRLIDRKSRHFYAAVPRAMSQNTAPFRPFVSSPLDVLIGFLLIQLKPTRSFPGVYSSPQLAAPYFSAVRVFRHTAA